MAIDPQSRRIDAVTADGRADFAKKVNTGVGPFYPNTFFPNTFQVITYGTKCVHGTKQRFPCAWSWSRPCTHCPVVL
jgi:hypothetical protein